MDRQQQQQQQQYGFGPTGNNTVPSSYQWSPVDIQYQQQQRHQHEQQMQQMYPNQNYRGVDQQQQHGMVLPPHAPFHNQMPLASPSSTGGGGGTTTTTNTTIGTAMLQTNNAPPMPYVNTAPTNSVPNDSSFRQLAQNSSLGGYGGDGVDTKRQPKPITCFTTKPAEALNCLVTPEIREDWSQVEKLNLTDPDRLDQMYVLLDALQDDKKFLVTYLCEEYRNKYQALFDKYNSLEVYVLYVVMVLVYGSEKDLKEYCDLNNGGYGPVPRAGAGGSSALRKCMFKGKRNGGAAAAADATGRSVESAAEERRARASSDPVVDDHPFFEERLYKSHRCLFHLGEMVKYCAPSEFAVMFCAADLSLVNLYQAGDKKVTQLGIRVVFGKPIVSLVRSRTLKAYNFQSLDLFGAMRDFMTSVTGMEVDIEPFKLSSLKNMTMKCLTTRESVADTKFDNSSGYYVAIITNLSCTNTNLDILNIRAYSTPIYHVPKGHVDVKAEDLDDMYDKATNGANFSARKDRLEVYYKRKDDSSGGGGSSSKPDVLTNAP